MATIAEQEAQIKAHVDACPPLTDEQIMGLRMIISQGDEIERIKGKNRAEEQRRADRNRRLDAMPDEASTRRNGFVYRLYDKDRQLLYIGFTGNVAARLKQHRERSRWFGEVDDWTSQEGTQEDETRAIKAEQPRHNKAGKQVKSGE